MTTNTRTATTTMTTTTLRSALLVRRRARHLKASLARRSTATATTRRATATRTTTLTTRKPPAGARTPPTRAATLTLRVPHRQARLARAHLVRVTTKMSTARCGPARRLHDSRLARWPPKSHQVGEDPPRRRPRRARHREVDTLTGERAARVQPDLRSRPIRPPGRQVDVTRAGDMPAREPPKRPLDATNTSDVRAGQAARRMPLIGTIDVNVRLPGARLAGHLPSLATNPRAWPTWNLRCNCSPTRRKPTTASNHNNKWLVIPNPSKGPSLPRACPLTPSRWETKTVA